MALAKVLTILAVVILIGVTGAWFMLGANTGWTRTLTPIKKVDPITEIEYTEYERGFVPGVDFLGLGLGLGVAFLVGGRILSRLANRKIPS